ncbi:alpha/beta hydrolase fold domain-containing protein [Treponema sp. HNW]|uniref:alpha/beta hydrolase n=1 Tax=Treponema sp. HNW TaxID=3116654 RepID=UPI003D0B56FC
MMRADTKKAVKKIKHLIFTPSADIEKFRQKLNAEFTVPILPNRVEREKRSIGGVDCDVFTPEVYASKRVLLYVHGGSFVGGSCAAWGNFCASFANASCTRIVLPEIHLAPQYPFPAALEDLKAVIKKLYAENDSIIIAGDGSGASIAVALVLSIKEKFRGKIDELVLFSPWFDISGDSESVKTPSKYNRDKIVSSEAIRAAAELYTYSANLTNPLVSPMFASPEMLAGLPDVYIQMADDELLKQDALCFQDKLRKADVPCELDLWEGMIHLFQMADEFLPQAHLAVEKAGAHIKNRQG